MNPKILLVAVAAFLLSACQTTPEPDPSFVAESDVGWGNCRPVNNLEPDAEPVLCEYIGHGAVGCDSREPHQTMVDLFVEDAPTLERRHHAERSMADGGGARRFRRA